MKTEKSVFKYFYIQKIESYILENFGIDVWDPVKKFDNFGRKGMAYL